MTRAARRLYTYWFLLPIGVVYAGLFLLPTFMSFFFSLTRWTLTRWQFIGLKNYASFFSELSLNVGFRNTLVFAVVTCGLKVILGMFFAVFLCSNIATKGFLRSMVFFPYLLSTIAVGTVFSRLMHPTHGLINTALAVVGIRGPDWLGNPHLALLSVALVEVWKGVGGSTIILIAGITSIPLQYYEAMAIDGARSWNRFWDLTLPLSRPAINSVIILSFIGGLRTFDLIWTMTKGGPGFSSDLITSIIYKQYQAGFYGLSTAGNVILFVFVALLGYPLYRFLIRREVDL